MKNSICLVLLSLLILTSCKTTFKLGQCEDLYLDLEKGTLNGVNPEISIEEVKKAFPCFTGDTEEGSTFNCGGGVFFLNNDFYFYTHRNYIEVRKAFSGRISSPVLNLSASKLNEIMKQKAEILNHEDSFMGNSTVHQFRKKWGTLSLLEEDGVIVEIQMHYGKKIEDIEYCF